MNPMDLINEIARMSKDGEDGFEMTLDDAAPTLGYLIDTARKIVRTAR